VIRNRPQVVSGALSGALRLIPTNSLLFKVPLAVGSPS